MEKDKLQKLHYSSKKVDDVNTITESSERQMNINSLNNLTPFKKGVRQGKWVKKVEVP